MSVTISQQQFIEFGRNRQAALAYVQSRMHLKDNYLIGRISSRPIHNDYFFIKDLVNPYTGLDVKNDLFTDGSFKASVFCLGGKDDFHFEIGDLVLFSFEVNTTRDKVEKGDIFKSSINELTPIIDAADVFRELEMSADDLEVVGLVKGDFYEEHGDLFIDFVKKNVQKKIDESMNTLKTQEKMQHERSEALKEEYRRINRQREQLTQSQEMLKELGFTFDTREPTEESIAEDLPIEDPVQMLDEIQKQLAARGLYYEKDLLRQVLTVLKTGQMLTLIGPSGTGKTTIVSELAKIIGAKYEIIPIQPSWTDKQDLLGYYNPIRQLYVPTAFLDCLVEAKQNENQLYFICLDEMNLAQIEYYLADVLSVREIEGEKLRLYSDYEYKQNMDEVKWFTQKALKLAECDSIEELIEDELKISSLEQYQLIQRYQNMQRYKPQIEIPRNVRIIGTMNIDGTVQPLSPKVIDRSFILPVNRQEKVEIEEVEPRTYNLPASYFELDAMQETKIEEDLRPLQEQLATLDAEYNDRVEKHINQYVQASNLFQMEEHHLIDEVVLMKILPRIHHFSEQFKNENELLELSAVTGEARRSAVVVQKMLEKYRENRIFSYWS